MDNKFQENIRLFFLKENTVKLIHELDDTIFQSAVVHSMIFASKKTKTELDYFIQTSTEKDLLLPKIDIINTFFLSQQYRAMSIRTYESSDELEYFKVNSIPLKKILDIRQAIKTGNDKEYITSSKIAENYMPILGGKHISKYSLENPHLYVNYGKHLACPRDTNIFEQPKILIREAGNEIIATYDENNFYIMSSLYNGILINSSFRIKYVLSLLNSNIYLYLMKKSTFDKTKGAFTKAKIFHYYELPVKNISHEIQLRFEILVDFLLFLNDKDKMRIFSHTENSRIASHIEDVLNMMVYELYFEEHMKEVGIDVLQFINPKPIAALNTNDEKAEVIKAFYLWLQTPDNPVRQRINIVDIKSPNIISKINLATQ